MWESFKWRVSNARSQVPGFQIMNKLIIDNIHKTFGTTRALSGVSFDVAEGEIVAVLGPSGCPLPEIIPVFNRHQFFWFHFPESIASRIICCSPIKMCPRM